MRRSVEVAQVVVVGRTLVRVAHNEADRTARRLALEHAAEQFHLVLLVALGRNVALTRPAAAQFALYELQVDVNARRHSVDNAADSLAMTLAECGESEKRSECVAHICFQLVLQSARCRLFLVVVSAATTLVLVMSAATAFVVVMSASTLMVSASAFATAAVASATATVHVAEHSLNLVHCSLAVLDDVALEVELLASERMVEVDLHRSVAYLEHCADEEVAILVLQRNLSALEDILAVELSVYGEHFLVEVDDALRLILAECLLLLKLEVELLAEFKVSRRSSRASRAASKPVMNTNGCSFVVSSTSVRSPLSLIVKS